MRAQASAAAPPGLRSRLFRVLREPVQVVGRAVSGWNSDEFGYVVTVHALDFRFESWKPFFDGFDQYELFARGLNFFLPAINGLHRAKNDGGASGQAFADNFAGDATSFHEIAASHQHDASGIRARHGFLQMVLG